MRRSLSRRAETKKNPYPGASLEDYLKTTLELGQLGKHVTTSDLARALHLSPATVTVTLKRLHLMKLIHHTPYQGCSLTPEGRRIALKLLRSHRVLECYLVGRLGYTWDEVDEEAERLEHALSDRVVNRMEEILGFPKRDPHGSPIPDRKLEYAFRLLSPLPEASLERDLVIEQVSCRDGKLLRRLKDLGLTPGESIRLHEKRAGEIIASVGGASVRVPKDLAHSILVPPTTDDN